jgi:hypothetical protein
LPNIFGERRPSGRQRRPPFPGLAWPRNPGGENQRIGFGLQRIAHPDEAGLVQRQTGVGQPGRAAGLGHPDDLVGLERRRAGFQGRGSGHLRIAMQRTALCSTRSKARRTARCGSAG